MPIFDPSSWSDRVRETDWYLDIPEVFEKLRALHDADHAAYEAERDRIYGFFEEKLRENRIALASSGPSQDAERMPIDTVVIHHTSGKPGLSKDRLSAVELARLYAPQYARDAVKNGIPPSGMVKGIYSGHLRNGAQVFWPYHWMVRSDGTMERLLRDEEIGWHAGNWTVNRRSIAICIDDDHEDTTPDQKIIKAIADLIRKEYPQVKREFIFGHCEINPKTTCPSRLFLGREGEKGWKEALLAML